MDLSENCERVSVRGKRFVTNAQNLKTNNSGFRCCKRTGNSNTYRGGFEENHNILEERKYSGHRHGPHGLLKANNKAGKTKVLQKNSFDMPMCSAVDDDNITL